MRQFSISAKSYIIVVLFLGGALTVQQLAKATFEEAGLLVAACAIASLLQAYKIEGPTNRTSYNLSWVVYGFTAVTMGIPAMIAVIVAAHLVEWAWHRYPWYIQTFNIASFAIAASLAGVAYYGINPSLELLSISGTLALSVAVAVFTLANHLMVGMAVKLVRGQGLVESGVMSPLALSLDYGMFCLGIVGALIWQLNPYTIVLVALVAYLLQKVLTVPALRRQTETDPKVGLYNSRYFATALDKELDRANRFNRPLTIVMADLDFLRQVNNSYGHLAGDEVLKGVAKILKQHAREFDIVARFGGEEFAILMPETNPEQAQRLAEEMRQAIRSVEFIVSTSVMPIRVTMSLGIASRTRRDLTADELVYRADMAVLQAKQEGRNCTRLYGSDPQPAPVKPQARAGLVVNGNRSARSTAKPELTIASTVRKPSRESTPPAVNGAPKISKLLKGKLPSDRWQLNLYVVAIFLAAATLIALLVRPTMDLDWTGLLAFAALVILVEAFSVTIYVKETSVSTSVAPLLAGVLLFGPVAALILGATVALVAFIRQRSTPDRLLFNSSNHVIGGLLAAGIIVLSGTPFVEWAMPFQLTLSLITIAVVFLSTTALVAGAVSLHHRRPLGDTWNERFRWLAPYYLALGVVAYTLVFSYSTAGLLGTLVVVVPLVMLRLSQKQYVDHTKGVVNQLRATNIKLSQQAEEISLLNDELLIALAKATDLRDPNTMEHSLNVAYYAQLIAKKLSLPVERIDLVRKAGLLHDIGKISVPDAILFKPGSLTDEEFDVVKGHVATGIEIIEGCHSLKPLIPIIQYHHERYDGDGYPAGLAGDHIPLEARILCVADALEAMSSDRPYRRALTPQDIVEELERCAGGQFDPMVVNAFARIVHEQGAGVFISSSRVREKGPGEAGQANPSFSGSESSMQVNPGLATS